MARRKKAVEGLPQLLKRMAQLRDPKVAGDIAKQMVIAGARFVKEDAKRRAPIAEKEYLASGSEKNHMVDSVMVQPGNVPKHIIIKRMTRTPYSAHYIVTLRGKKRYGYAKRIGALIEYGTVKQAPRPFLGPALSQNIQEIKDLMAKRGRAAFKRELKKMGVS